MYKIIIIRDKEQKILERDLTKHEADVKFDEWSTLMNDLYKEPQKLEIIAYTENSD